MASNEITPTKNAQLQTVVCNKVRINNRMAQKKTK